MVLVTGFAYPLLVTEIASVIAPDTAGGSLLRYPGNGTVEGSSLVAQNLSAPFLFWERPSLSDYNLLNGAPSPPGPTEPGLAALLNETIAYMKLYGNLTVNVTLPFWWVAPSGSSVDPHLVPEAVLIQVPRVANATHLGIPFVQNLVNNHIVQPWIPYLGVAYVDVLQLDLALYAITGMA
jgi:K+-transporting ATPase ATPase C chain